MYYEKKILPTFFRDVIAGDKCFELRKDDCDYTVGDTVRLREWTGIEYTGQEIEIKIKYVLRDCPQYGLLPGHCIFGW